MKTTNLLLSLAVGVSLQANAVEIMDHESIPSNYATVEKVVNEVDNSETFTIHYKQDANAWRAPALDKILRSYGVELMPELAENLPGDFASVVQVEQQADEMTADQNNGSTVQVGMTEVEYEINFGNNAIVWRPKALHRVFAAYNLVPDLDNFENVPEGYSTDVETEQSVVNEQTGEQTIQSVRELKLGGSATFWRAGLLNRILSGYKKGDMSVAPDSEELAAQ